MKQLIKRCPFCGGEAKMHATPTGMFHIVGCSTRDCRGNVASPPSNYGAAHALAEWNSRADGWNKFRITTDEQGNEIVMPPLPEAGRKILVTTADGDVRVDEAGENDEEI